MTHFGDRLFEAVTRVGTPVLVGLDPRLSSLPAALRRDVDANEPHAVAAAFTRFCCDVIDVVAPLVPSVKPQAAFFEQLGPAGMQALAETVAHARRCGLLVIMDGKRNDIGSTAAAYADAYLGAESAWGADALTVSPYLGDDSLVPFFDIAKQRGGGVFVLVKTSNPGGGLFQDLVADSSPLYRHVANYVEGRAAESLGARGYGSVGAVVGATYPEELVELRSIMPHTWILVPGFGAQGGTAKDVAAAMDGQGQGAIVNSSRGIIFAHSRPEFKDSFGDAQWQGAVEAATQLMIDQLRTETPAGKLARG
ncbi:MAG TPA: orotidine-5'-phosphate decarboxylase [Pirellulaceae bacterium]|jgi:orotidine-5'-phosphate decarboxylase|nr:orotidine-5'-phosphate decarboxylase [Pirellulaceae bacterium]